MGSTACTEPQCLYKGALYFTVDLYLYSPYGQYSLYRASVPVQGCTLLYSRAIPLLPLWAVQPVQSLSACTRGHFTFLRHRTLMTKELQSTAKLKSSWNMTMRCFTATSRPLWIESSLWKTINGDKLIAFSFRTKKIIDYVAAFLVGMAGYVAKIPSLNPYPANVEKMVSS